MAILKNKEYIKKKNLCAMEERRLVREENERLRGVKVKRFCNMSDCGKEFWSVNNRTCDECKSTEAYYFTSRLPNGGAF